MFRERFRLEIFSSKNREASAHKDTSAVLLADCLPRERQAEHHKSYAMHAF